MQETWVQSLGREDPLEEEMATHSSILAWEIPWTEEPDRLQSMELRKSQTAPSIIHTHTQRHEPRSVGCLYRLEKTRKQILPETHFRPISLC